MLLRETINRKLNALPPVVGVPALAIHESFRWSAYASCIFAAVTTQPQNVRNVFSTAAGNALACKDIITTIEMPVDDFATDLSLSVANDLSGGDRNIVQRVRKIGEGVGWVKTIFVTGPARIGATVGAHTGTFLRVTGETVFNDLTNPAPGR